MLFRKTDAPGTNTPLTPKPPVVGDEQWGEFGVSPSSWDEKGISCRIRMLDSRPETMDLAISLRLEEEFDHDVDLQVTLADQQGDLQSMLLPFGDGIWPAYLLPRKSAWTFILPGLPKNTAIMMKATHKPSPAGLHPTQGKVF
jgi:hypothetical protein